MARSIKRSYIATPRKKVLAINEGGPKGSNKNLGAVALLLLPIL